MKVRVRNENGLQGFVSAPDNLECALDDWINLLRFVHGAHVAKAQVGIDLDPIPYLST
jgi:hypothetical protein